MGCKRACCMMLQVRQAQQMATLVSRKKGELAAKVERLQERRDTLAAALDNSSSHGGNAGCGDDRDLVPPGPHSFMLTLLQQLREVCVMCSYPHALYSGEARAALLLRCTQHHA